MSGGSHNYICYKLEDFATDLVAYKPECLKRKGFAELIKLVAKAAHDIEWVDSGDHGEGAEFEAIKKVFNFLSNSPSTALKAQEFDALRNMLMAQLDLKERL